MPAKKAEDAVPTIYELLPKVAKAIGAIGKTGSNTAQNYKFRAIDDVVNAAHPAFTEHGVFVTSEVIDQEREVHQGRNSTLHYSILRVKFTFYAPDGSHVSSTTVGEGMDSGDKASNKAMSAALKYALGQTFLIPFDLKDSEDDSPESTGRNSRVVILQFKDKKPIKKDVGAMTADELVMALDCAEWRGKKAKDDTGKFAEKNRAEARADWQAIKDEMNSRKAASEPSVDPESDPIPVGPGLKAEKKQPEDMTDAELSSAYDATQIVLSDEFSTDREREAAQVAVERLEYEIGNRSEVATNDGRQ